jgi:hypothetical protein
MRLSCVLGVVAAMLLAACNHAAPEPPSSAAVAAVATAPGTGVIRGRGYVRMPDGDIVTCARLPVRAVGDDASKEVKCGPDGYFEFRDLKAGVWGLSTDVLWRIKDRPLLQGVHLRAPYVVVKPGQETNATLGQSLCCGHDATIGWADLFTVDMATGRISEWP